MGGHDVLALIPNLLFAVQLDEALKARGDCGKIVSGLADWQQALQEKRFHLGIVNLAIAPEDWREAVLEAKELNMPVLAFGPHLDRVAFDAAETLGCDVTVPNAKFTTSLSELLDEWLDQTGNHYHNSQNHSK